MKIRRSELQCERANRMPGAGICASNQTMVNSRLPGTIRHLFYMKINASLTAEYTALVV